LVDKSFYQVHVRFGPGFSLTTQGEVMLDLEKALRARGLPAEVFKDTMGDDSKLRRAMTEEQRHKL